MFLHGPEYWTLTQEQMRKTERAEARFLRASRDTE
jgi:hypothetical protein